MRVEGELESNLLVLYYCAVKYQAMGRAGKDDKVPFNHLLKECVLAGEWGAATEAVQRMLHQAKGGKGIRFDSKTFRALSTVSDYFQMVGCR